MGWIGKIVGGAIGFFLGGPLGAVLGVALGHGFDWSSRNLKNDFGRFFSPFQQSELTFFVAAFSMISKLTASGGRITPDKAKIVDEFMRRDLALDEESIETAMRIMNAAQSSPQSFEDFALQFYSAFHTNPQLLRMMIDVLLRVAVADGAPSREAESLIHSAASIFGLSEEELDAMISRYSRQIDRYYAILQSRREDRTDEIKRNYRRLVNEYHPDKIASKGLPDEFARYATDKFREIQDAYEKVRSERGFS